MASLHTLPVDMLENIYKFTTDNRRDAYNFINTSSHTRETLNDCRNRLIALIAEEKEQARIRDEAFCALKRFVRFLRKEDEACVLYMTIKYPQTGKTLTVCFDAMSDEVRFLRRRNLSYAEFEAKVRDIANEYETMYDGDDSDSDRDNDDQDPLIEFPDGTSIGFERGHHMTFDNDILYGNQHPTRKTSTVVMCKFLIWCMYDYPDANNTNNVVVTLNIEKDYWSKRKLDWMCEKMRVVFPKSKIKLVDGLMV